MSFVLCGKKKNNNRGGEIEAFIGEKKKEGEKKNGGKGKRVTS